MVCVRRVSIRPRPAIERQTKILQLAFPFVKINQEPPAQDEWSALAIALLLKSPKLLPACRSWLPENRYTVVDLGLTGGVTDFQAALEQQREAVDAVVIEQSLLEPDLRRSLLEAGLLFPAVVVGEVMGRVDYHPEGCIFRPISWSNSVQC